MVRYGREIRLLSQRAGKFKRRSKIQMKPNTLHSIVADENTMIHEISTPYPDDVVRIKDFYTAR